MSPELLASVRERIDIGHAKPDIIRELIAAGYPEDRTEEIYEAATQYSSEQSFDATQNDTPLIGYRALFTASWQLLKINWKVFVKAFCIAGALLVSMLVVIVAAVAAGVSVDSVQQASPAMLVGFGIGVLVLILLFSVALTGVNFSIIRNLTALDRSETFSESVRWSFKNIVPIIILGLFIYLATQTGYLLFVIPGIAFVVYTYFAKYVLATQEVKGLDAMVRSTELVYGRFWGVLGRLLFVSVTAIILVVFLILVGITILAVAGLGFDQTGIQTIVAGAGVGLMMVGLVAYLHCMAVVLFQSLVDSAQSTPLADDTKKRVRFWFKVMVIVGPIAAILLQIPSALNEMSNDQMSITSESVPVSLPAQAETAYFVSEAYYLNDGEFSYQGACEQIASVVEEGIDLECNATDDEWAVRLTDMTGDAWCVDSAGYDKQSYVPLDGGISCLALPDASELEVLSASSTAGSN